MARGSREGGSLGDVLHCGELLSKVGWKKDLLKNTLENLLMSSRLVVWTRGTIRFRVSLRASLKFEIVFVMWLDIVRLTADAVYNPLKLETHRIDVGSLLSCALESWAWDTDFHLIFSFECPWCFSLQSTRWFIARSFLVVLFLRATYFASLGTHSSRTLNVERGTSDNPCCIFHLRQSGHSYLGAVYFSN